MVEAVDTETRGRRLVVHDPTVAVLAIVSGVIGWCVRVWTPAGAVPLVWNDSADYVAASREPLISLDRLVGLRPVLMPLVLSAADGDHVRFVVAQQAAAAIAWGLLVGAVASCFRDLPRQILASLAVLALSLTWPIVMWDQQVLTESLALSSFALLVAAGLWFAKQPTAVRGAVLVAAALVWLLARDSHTIPIAVVGVGLVVAGSALRLPPRRVLGLTGAYLVAISFLVAGAAHHGQRDRQPIEHVYAARILPYPERVEWFAAHGMPLADELEALPEALDPVQDLAPFTPVAREPQWAPWRRWLADHGRTTLVAYALAHPSYVWDEPLQDPERTFNNGTGVRGYVPLEMNEVPAVSTIFYPPVPLTLAVAIVALLVIGLRRLPWSPLPVVGSIVVAAAAPHALVVWHSDGMESARHLLVPSVQLRTGVLLLVLAACGRAHSRPEPATG